jgi:membrane fusion protein (multidrug efflux system)
MRRQFWFLGLLILMLIIGVGLYIKFHQTAGSPQSSLTAGRALPGQPGNEVDRLPVKTVQAQKRNLEVTLPVFGAITYLDKIEIASEVPGVLHAVPVEPGDLVRVGQVVAVINTDLLKAELKTKAAMKGQAEAQLQVAAWQFQSQKKVFGVGGIPQKDLEEAEARYREKRAEVARYASEMAQTQLLIKKATIVSPITGIVGLKNFNRGERIPTQSDKGVVSLMQIDSVYAEAEINEKDMARLRPGLDVMVFPDAYPQTHFQGKIERLEPVLKQESRSLIAKVRLANKDLLMKPGMFTRMEIILDRTPQVVALPTASLRQAGDKSFQVFVVSDEVAFLRKVVPGLVTRDWVEIKEGLEPGEVVVVEGAERLKDLSRVISTPAPPPRP